MAHRLFILNGPNLNRLGRREPELYGRDTLADIERRCRELAGELGLEVFFAQSNAEGEVIEWVHRACDEDAAVVINPAGLSTKSVALLDALRMVRQPIVEVHLTNVFQREAHYQQLLTAYAVWGFVAGFGATGYELAIRGLAQKLAGGERR